jgi:hypothetical protein
MDDLRVLTARLDAMVAGADGDAPMLLCHEAVTALPVSGAAVSMTADVDHRVMVCATDGVAARLEELQFSFGEGPCVDSMAAGRPVLVADLAEVGDARWPMFAAEARRTTARALYALPLQIGAIGVGVLDLYRVEAGPLRDEELTGALLIADAVLWILLNHRSSLTPGSLDGRGWAAEGRLDTEVHQATGMIMAQSGLSAEAALARLRAFAFAHDLPLAVAARDVVSRRLRFEPLDE